jgi:hypothetical protein
MPLLLLVVVMAVVVAGIILIFAVQFAPTASSPHHPLEVVGSSEK